MKTSRISKVDIIAAALLGKYVDWELKKLTEITLKISKKDKVDLRRCDEHKSLVTDIIRQLEIFEKIEAVWLRISLSLEILMEINSIANGLNLEESRFRDFEHVPDFGGDALTESKNIKAELETLKYLLQKANNLIFDDKVIHSQLMARVFFEIIRIHPFPDGNGRTARFVIELMARKWGYRYIIIPKYRNDSIWRSALDKAADGDNSAIEAYFLERLHKMQ